jgi:hypothetical protein
MLYLPILVTYLCLLLFPNLRPEFLRFESLEKALRQKMLEEVGPGLGSFFFQKYQKLKQEKPEQ